MLFFLLQVSYFNNLNFLFKKFQEYLVSYFHKFLNQFLGLFKKVHNCGVGVCTGRSLVKENCFASLENIKIAAVFRAARRY